METADIIASAATIIALSSLFVTIFEARQSRFHSRASVRPTLQITSHGGRPTAGLRLKNVGLGPAIIFETKLFVDGEYVGKYNQENVENIADKLEKMIETHISKSTFGNDDFVVEPNYSMFIFAIRDFDDEQNKKFFDFLRERISVVLQYRSLYGEEANVIFGQEHLRSDQIK